MEFNEKKKQLNDLHRERVRARLEEYLLSKGIDTSAKFACIAGTHDDCTSSMFLDRKLNRACCELCGAKLDIFEAIGKLENIQLRSEQYARGYLWAGYDSMGYPIYDIMRFREEEEASSDA